MEEISIQMFTNIHKEISGGCLKEYTEEIWERTELVKESKSNFQAVFIGNGE